MVDAIRRIETIPGDIVECGVWRGGNIILARQLAPERTCWLYDTFDGMTPPCLKDGDKATRQFNRKTKVGVKHSAVSLPDVRRNLDRFGALDDTKLKFVAGDVRETLPHTRPERIALLRLDTDWYESTLAELQWLYPLLVTGGILIIDDYGHWPGARRAVDEYFVGQSIDMQTIDYSARMMTRC